MVELTQTYATYQAQTKLLELAVEIANSKSLSKPEIKAKINRNTKIRLWLKALTYSDFLEKSAIDKLVYCLADLCDANALPYAPSAISSVSQPSILIGGTTNITNNYYTDATDFSNPDVDTGTDNIDTFAATLARGAVWHYTIRDQAGVNQRSGVVVASWLASGSTVVYTEESTVDIGTTIGVVTLSVDYSSPNIRLRATSTNDNYIVEGTRYLING